MPERIPQSTTIRVPLYAVLASDHVSKATGKTIAVTLSKNGAAFGNPSAGATNATEIASGWYYVDLSTTDTGTLGPLIVLGTAGTIDDCTIAYNVAVDAVNLIQVNGHSVTDTTNGVLDVNAKNIGGTAQTGRDIGASVLLSAGSGAGQLDFTSGVVKANATQWLGGTIPAVNVTGVPLIDLKYTLGTISPATAGSVRADAVTGAVGSVTGLTASNLDATVSSRLATSGYTAPDNTSVAAIKTQTDKMAFTVTNQIDANVLDWKSATAPAMTGDAYARLGAPAGASVSADVAAVKVDTAAVKVQTDKLAFTVTNQVDTNIKSVAGTTVHGAGTSGSPWGP